MFTHHFNKWGPEAFKLQNVMKATKNQRLSMRNIPHLLMSYKWFAWWTETHFSRHSLKFLPSALCLFGIFTRAVDEKNSDDWCEWIYSKSHLIRKNVDFNCFWDDMLDYQLWTIDYAVFLHDIYYTNFLERLVVYSDKKKRKEKKEKTSIKYFAIPQIWASGCLLSKFSKGWQLCSLIFTFSSKYCLKW